MLLAGTPAVPSQTVELVLTTWQLHQASPPTILNAKISCITENGEKNPIFRTKLYVTRNAPYIGNYMVAWAGLRN